MIYLALEVPKAHLEEFEKYQDFNYAIAPWLIHDEYLEYFSREGKPLWLDNGVNEYNYPATLATLQAYAETLKAQVIVPPDNPRDPPEYIDALVDITMGGLFKAVGCLLDSYRDRWNEIAAASDIIAIPYDLKGSRDILPFPYPKPIHLFGFRMLQELTDLQGKVTSIDTGMPIKLAARGEKIEHYLGTRYGLKTTPGYINLKLTEAQNALAHRNCMVLRHCCDGLSIEEGVREADNKRFSYP